jgi:glycosyltransferase involved in cell wall biosynthesis
MKVVLYANTDWYLYNFRRSLALALQAAGYPPILLTPDGPYGERLRALGLDWRPVPMERRSLNPLQESRLLLWLVSLFRAERPALVHGFTIKCAVYGAIAARVARVPARISAVAGMGYVFTNDAPKARLLRPLVGALLRLALAGRRGRLILQNADDVALFERAGFIDAGNIRLIPGSGVDCTRFSPRDPDEPPSDPKCILLATRLLWDKGVAEYVAAATQLHGEGRNLRFLLAGDPDPGNPAAVPTESVRVWERGGCIEWLGHVDDMPALLAAVDVVVLPSYREGLPKTLIEAAACALPLVTTDVPGCRAVVTDGRDGLLVPAADSQALANAIRRLDDDPALGQRLGQAARAKALAQFDERIVIQRTLEVYGEVLGKAPRPTAPPPPRPPGTPGATPARGTLHATLLGLSAALLLFAVLIPSRLLGWIMSNVAWFGRFVNWMADVSPRVNLMHVVLFAVIALLAGWSHRRWSRWQIAAVLALVGITTELVQFLVPGRHPRVDDLWCDALGIAAGLGLAALVSWAGSRAFVSPVRAPPAE